MFFKCRFGFRVGRCDFSSCLSVCRLLGGLVYAS
jgi:hypothetical protein